jgi:hypothetical protein
MRVWANAHHEHTRHLIERRRLAEKAGLFVLRDGRAVLLGVWLRIAETLHGAADVGDDRHQIVTRGPYRAFDADRAGPSPQPQVRRQEGI